MALGDHAVSGSTGRSTLLSLLLGRSEALSSGQGQWILRSQHSPGREGTGRRTVQTEARASQLRRRLPSFPHTPGSAPTLRQPVTRGGLRLLKNPWWRGDPCPAPAYWTMPSRSSDTCSGRNPVGDRCIQPGSTWTRHLPPLGRTLCYSFI